MRVKARNTLIFVFSTLFLVVIGLAIYQESGPIYREMDKLDLIPTPQRFTELYFNNYLTFPKETVKGQSFPISFTIHNLEGTTTTYPYAIYFEYPTGDEAVFASSTVTVPNNASTTITVTHTFNASNLTGKVFVDLTGMNQEIDFILPNNNQ